MEYFLDRGHKNAHLFRQDEVSSCGFKEDKNCNTNKFL